MKTVRVALIAVVLVGGIILLTTILTQRGPATRQVSGTIEIDEVLIASRYGGRVARIAAAEGDELPPGQLIVQLEARELQARRTRLAAALLELQNGPRTEEIAAALADRDALAAQLKFAESEQKRAVDLFAQNTIAASERDRTVSQAETLARSLAAAEQRYQLLKTGTRPEQITQARAQLAELDTQLAEMQITAPAPTPPPAGGGERMDKAPAANSPPPEGPGVGAGSGPRFVLEVLNVKVGDVLAPNQPVATLLKPQQLWVRVYVPELWLGRIQLGETVTVKVDSHPDQGFHGTVEQLNRAAEFTPRNVQTVGERIKQVFGIKVRLPSDTGILKAGMAADVYFPNVPPVPKDR